MRHWKFLKIACLKNFNFLAYSTEVNYTNWRQAESTLLQEEICQHTATLEAHQAANKRYNDATEVLYRERK